MWGGCRADLYRHNILEKSRPCENEHGILLGMKRHDLNPLIPLDDLKKVVKGLVAVKKAKPQKPKTRRLRKKPSR
jgi:hypothetical protein